MNATLAAILAAVAKRAWRMARDHMASDAAPKGEWKGNVAEYPATHDEIGAAGYDQGKPCVRLVIDSRSPLRFVHESGVEWAVPTGLISDGGSIPSWATKGLRKWFELNPLGKKRFAFYLHDAAYHYGGLWMRANKAAAWEFVPVTRMVADLLLYQGLTATGSTNGDCKAIYAAVRSPFGRASWNRAQKRMRDAKKQAAATGPGE